MSWRQECSVDELSSLSNQIVELKLEHEQEKTHLLQQHNAEKESLVRDHEREVGNLENKLRAANMEHENQIQEFKKRDSQVITNDIW